MLEIRYFSVIGEESRASDSFQEIKINGNHAVGRPFDTANQGRFHTIAFFREEGKWKIDLEHSMSQSNDDLLYYANELKEDPAFYE